MNFQETLATLPEIGHLNGLNICSEDGDIAHHIPAAPGKLGSLRVYYTLAQRYHDKLDSIAAYYGLSLFAEHTADARQHPGKHPNIDLLIAVIDGNLHYRLVPLEDDI